MKLYFDKITNLINERGYSITGLCRIIGVTRATLWKWKNKIQNPTEINLVKLADALGVSVGDISDIEETTVAVQKDFSKIAKSWQVVAGMKKTQQNSKYQELINNINSLNADISQTKVIINALVFSMDNIFYIKDTEQNYVIASESFIENLKLNKGYNVFGKNDSDFFPGREAKKNYGQDKLVLKTGKSISHIEDFIPGSKRKRWGLISKHPILDSENIIVGILGVVVDITEKKKAEETKNIMMKLLDIAPFGINFICLDDYKKMFHLNKAMAAGYNLSLESLYELVDKYGMEYLDKTFLYEEDTKKWISEGAEFIDRRNIVRVKDVNNRIKWVSNAQAFLKHNNKTYCLGVSNEYTLNKMSELKEETYHEMINSLVADNQEIIWGINIDKSQNIYLYFISDNFEKITGYYKSDFCISPNTDQARVAIPYYSNPEVPKKTIISIIHTNYHNLIKKVVKLGKLPKKFKFKIVSAKGKILTLETTISRKEVAGLDTIYFGKAKVIL